MFGNSYWTTRFHSVPYRHAAYIQGSNLLGSKGKNTFLISNFCCVLNVVFFLLGNSMASEDGTDSVPKRRQIKFKRWGITLKKAYNRRTHTRIRDPAT
jgi:hypothetical protein